MKCVHLLICAIMLFQFSVKGVVSQSISGRFENNSPSGFLSQDGHVAPVPDTIENKASAIDTITLASEVFLDTDTLLFDHLEPIIIISDRNKSNQQLKPFSSIIMKDEDLNVNRGNSLMETLEMIPGIHAMSIGSSISRPVIRGLEGYRVLLCDHGIKLIGQRWNEHQGLEIDQYVLNEIEIAKGPQSIGYGSDAIGGIINIPSLIPALNNGCQGEVMMTGKSNNGSLGATARFSGRRNEFYYFLNAHYQAYGDYHVPADSFDYKPNHQAYLNGVMSNTAGREYASRFLAGWQNKKMKNELVMGYYFHNTGFFNINEILGGENRENNKTHDIGLPSQKTQNLSLLNNNTLYGEHCTFDLTFGFQQHLTAEYDYLEDISGERADDLALYGEENLDLELILDTYSTKLTIASYHINQHAIKAGIDYHFSSHQKDGFGHLLPNYQSHAAGIFISDDWDISNTLKLSQGIRYDIAEQMIEASVNPDPSVGDEIFNPNIDNAFSSLTFSLGVLKNWNENNLFKASIGKSFRLPSVYELASYGIHRHTMRFEKGNSSLNPEEAYQADINMTFKSDKILLTFNPFFIWFRNYIYLQPTPEFYQGSYTGQIYVYAQNKAIHTGLECYSTCDIVPAISMDMGASYVYAVNLDFLAALPGIPPLTTNFGLMYHHVLQNTQAEISIKWEGRYMAAQNLVAINEWQTPSSFIMNILMEIAPHGSWWPQCSLRVNNLLDTSYFNHLSYYRNLSIPEQGRDIQLSIKFPINIKSNCLNNTLKNEKD